MDNYYYYCRGVLEYESHVLVIVYCVIFNDMIGYVFSSDLV